MRNDHKLSGLKEQTLILPWLWSPEVEVKVSARPGSDWSSAEGGLLISTSSGGC